MLPLRASLFAFLMNEHGRQIGEVEAVLRDSWCDADARALMTALGRRKLPTLVVVRSMLDAEHRSRGLGAELYAALAWAAATYFRAALVPHDCLVPGHTSDDAKRVWLSKRFNAHVTRVGRAAYWKDPTT